MDYLVCSAPKGCQSGGFYISNAIFYLQNKTPFGGCGLSFLEGGVGAGEIAKGHSQLVVNALGLMLEVFSWSTIVSNWAMVEQCLVLDRFIPPDRRYLERGLDLRKLMCFILDSS